MQAVGERLGLVAWTFASPMPCLLSREASLVVSPCYHATTERMGIVCRRATTTLPSTTTTRLLGRCILSLVMPASGKVSSNS